MKKLFLVFITLIITLVPAGFPAYAQNYEPTKVEVAVKIEYGGTAIITSEVNCPVPENERLDLDDGQTGKFIIYFTEPGVYSYTVKETPDKRDLNFDDTVYDVDIYITDDSGKLVSTVIVSTENGKYSSRSGLEDYELFGPDNIVFVNGAKRVPEPPTEPTTEPPKEDDNKNRNPKTGDDSKMEMYFLIAMLASAGLLMLSIVYMIDTQKLINEKKKQSAKDK